MPSEDERYFERKEVGDIREKWLAVLKDLNVCSQKGLVEMFDGSIGAGSVLMPYGGKYQLTETQAMVAKLPVLKGKTDTVTMMLSLIHISLFLLAECWLEGLMNIVKTAIVFMLILMH